MSGIGKGVTTAALGAVLQGKGYSVTAMKADPYINVDAGTMNPVEHGEVFVTDDGLETDQDIGNYERFLHTDLKASNYLTTGRVYLTVIERERNLQYQGKCVEVVPDIPEEIIRRILIVEKETSADFILVEIGGTVGEYQNLLFLEAGRMMHLNDHNRVAFLIVSYVPKPNTIGEMKTKPTQYAVRTLNSAGIQPDFIIARATEPLDEPRKEKLSRFCNIAKENVISAPDVNSIYEVPLLLEKEDLGEAILRRFHLPAKKRDLKLWRQLAERIKSVKKPVRIGIVGKYFKTGRHLLADSYISIIEAIKHAAWVNNRQPEITWLNADDYEKNPNQLAELKNFDGIIVPGGFGSRGVEGKIKAIQYVREYKIPYLGLCYGMQLACVEIARHVLGLKDAHTTEINPKTPDAIIDLMPEQLQLMKERHYGGTMRLGAYECALKPGTLARAAYGAVKVSERHRHRYEFMNKYRAQFEKAGVVFSGVNPERDLVEIVELKGHPFFVGTQFHPELKSRPLKPHPLFVKFIAAARLRSPRRK